jgi:uncharacterized protein YcfL
MTTQRTISRSQIASLNGMVLVLLAFLLSGCSATPNIPPHLRNHASRQADGKSPKITPSGLQASVKSEKTDSEGVPSDSTPSTVTNIENNNKKDKPLFSVLPQFMKYDGKEVHLVSSFIESGMNPFFSLVAEHPIEDPLKDLVKNQPVEPLPEVPIIVVNPIDEISLTGIVYNPKSPMALVMFEEAGSLGSTQKIVHPHDVITVKADKILIQAIHSNAIDLKTINTKSPMSRTITLPSMIGFSGKSAQSATNPLAASKQVENLPNLQKLSEATEKKVLPPTLPTNR